MKVQNATAQPPLDWNRVDPRLKEAAEGMEANFVKQLMKSMRSTVEESPETRDNQGIQIFRGMLDDHHAEAAARGRGLGIAEMIVRYLTAQDSMPIPAETQAKIEAREMLGKEPQEGVHGK